MLSLHKQHSHKQHSHKQHQTEIGKKLAKAKQHPKTKILKKTSELIIIKMEMIMKN